MRSPIKRRSASIWVSPGPPRKPKPPRCRPRWVQDLTRPAALVLQVREFHLHRPFARAAPLAEDVEDEPGPVDDLAAPLALEVALLHRAERGVDHGEFGGMVGDGSAERRRLPLAEQGRGPPGAQRDHGGVHHLEADRLGEFDHLGEARVGAAGLVAR
jgi:hypothetical protein